jgi:hypothetical protein
MPATIRHAFGATLGLRVVPELYQPPTEEPMHATQVVMLGFSRFKEIDFELTLEQQAFFLVGRSRLASAESRRHRQPV